MWIGSVVLALILGAILTVLGNGWLTRVGDVHQVGSLREVDDFAWPESLGTETADARGYTEFEGLTVITSEQQWAGIGTDTCMLVVKSADVTLPHRAAAHSTGDAARQPSRRPSNSR